MVLIGLISRYFAANLSLNNLPSHFIHIRKEDIVNIRSICVNFDVKGINLTGESIDLSKLEHLGMIFLLFYTE